MICQHCKVELEANGLQSFGHTLEQNFCCICWFAFAIYLYDPTGNTYFPSSGCREVSKTS